MHVLQRTLLEANQNIAGTTNGTKAAPAKANAKNMSVSLLYDISRPHLQVKEKAEGTGLYVK